VVAGALRQRKVEPVVLDSSVFPTGLPVSLAYCHEGMRGRWGDDTGIGISAVWQNLVVGSKLPAMAPGVRETCVAASEVAFVELLDGLQVFQLDPHWTKQRAGHKPHQLRMAQRLGLEIPETIISNDPTAVRAFAGRCGEIITKMLVPAASAGPDDNSAVFTTSMTTDDLEQLDGLDLCPMIFQERIENQLDVRVTVVGKRVFAAAIDRTARGGDDPDWRKQSYALDRAPTWAAYQLPDDTRERLLALMDHVGLNYGAIDLIVRPDGGHVFLELNASGAFVFLGASHAEPIAEAIAEVLLDPAARRVP
jgi:glutathione synthase/RimK-type ligase-like ATP-grasp enzyme